MRSFPAAHLTIATFALTLAAFALSSSVASPALANIYLRTISLRYKDAPLGRIFSRIAAEGDFSVDVDPRIASTRMTVVLKDVEPLDALMLVAKISEFRVRRQVLLDNRTSFRISSWTSEPDGAIREELAEAIDLTSIDACEAARCIEWSMFGVRTEHDRSTRRVVIYARDQATLREAIGLVARLDVPSNRSDQLLNVCRSSTRAHD